MNKLGTCRECHNPILEGEDHTKLSVVEYCTDSMPKGSVVGMHVDCCQHLRCNGNYEDVWCMDCGADYNNGRLL